MEQAALTSPASWFEAKIEIWRSYAHTIDELKVKRSRKS